MEARGSSSWDRTRGEVVRIVLRMHRGRVGLLLAGLLLVSGCSTMQNAPLEGSRWRWVSIEHENGRWENAPPGEQSHPFVTFRPGILNINGGLELADTAVYHCEIGAWDEAGVPDPWTNIPAGGPINDQIKMVVGDAFLSGALELTAVSKLNPDTTWCGERK